jgi:hypothetical protein
MLGTSKKMKTDDIKIIYARKIYEMLSLIQKRPTLFLTSKSISSLQDYLNGYLIWTLGNNEIYNPGDPDFDNFKYWMLSKDDRVSGVGFPYSRILLLECEGQEEKAFDRFFEYLEEYKAESAQNNKND